MSKRAAKRRLAQIKRTRILAARILHGAERMSVEATGNGVVCVWCRQDVDKCPLHIIAARADPNSQYDLALEAYRAAATASGAPDDHDTLELAWAFAEEVTTAWSLLRPNK